MARLPPLYRQEHGLAAIEFALIFPIFFLLFYGLVSWAVTLTLQQSINFAAQSAARAALAARIDDVPPATHLANATTLARAEVGRVLDWMPAEWKARVLGSGNDRVELQVTSESGTWWVQVAVRYPAFAANPPLPRLRLPGGISFPPLPDQLIGQATLRL